MSRMKMEGIIERNGNGTKLTSKGEKRFKRTTKSEREKWKREISDIVCRWLGKEGHI
jgi:Mn-dependent DtxR family transcriptional regulator